MNRLTTQCDGCTRCSPARPNLIRLAHCTAAIVAAAVAVPGCTWQQARFDTPDDAAGAFVQAVRTEDADELQRILGPGGGEIMSSGDDVADRRMRETFLAAYDKKNALVAEADGSMVMEIGEDDWPMPIPIVERGRSWRFDTRRGKEEILNRRIGRNELSVQEVCLAFVDAQREYVAHDHNGDGVREYAQKLISDEGQKNGLYWETSEGEPPSPMGPLVAEAVEEGYGRSQPTTGERRPYHGYYFKLLKKQGKHAPGGAQDYCVDGRMTGGFAVIAWPAEYDNSGVMTFLVSHQGLVYERDLGRPSARIASAMSEFDPDDTWKPCAVTR